MKQNKCECPHCEMELKKKCFSPDFCSPCSVTNRNTTICPVCKSEYLKEYEGCPACKADKK